MIDVSVILCTWNNCARLATTLDALRGCPAPEGVRWELILVNNGSTDDTPAVARRFAERLPLVYVEESRPGLSRAKNAALRVARGRLLVFADDDVTPGRDWLAVYWTASRDRPAGYYFGGPITSDYEGGRPEEEILRVAGHSITGLDWGSDARPLDDGERVYPANWACPAAAIRAAGGFDPGLGLDASLGRRRVGETFDLMDRLTARGMSAWYLPEARVVHFVPRAKCSRRFLGHNAEAIGRYSLRAARPHPFVIRRPELRPLCEKPGPTILGVPWRLAARSVMLGGRSMWAWTRGRPGLSEYLLWRFCVGRVKGYRALRRTSKER
ncbi:MAG: glycosyltransferase family 2 protein [Candidatus Rokuibacteriota bacterium]